MPTDEQLERAMRIPVFRIVGTCSQCNQVVPVKADSCCSAALEHLHEGKRCPGSDYSVVNPYSVILTPEEALAVATFLRDDTGACLINGPGHGHNHSLACGDGEDCDEIRRDLAHALAVYYLDGLEIEKERETKTQKQKLKSA